MSTWNTYYKCIKNIESTLLDNIDNVFQHWNESQDTRDEYFNNLLASTVLKDDEYIMLLVSPVKEEIIKKITISSIMNKKCDVIFNIEDIELLKNIIKYRCIVSTEFNLDYINDSYFLLFNQYRGLIIITNGDDDELWYENNQLKYKQNLYILYPLNMYIIAKKYNTNNMIELLLNKIDMLEGNL